jgi:hypothetical protein
MLEEVTYSGAVDDIGIRHERDIYLDGMNIEPINV